MPVLFRDLVSSVARLTGLHGEEARAVTEVAVIALARSVPEPGRGRLLAVLPGDMAAFLPLARPPSDRTDEDVVRELARLGRRAPAQARAEAMAVYASLCEHDPGLAGELDLPGGLAALFTRPRPAPAR
ncbi:uncharacterized protein DUF2267 [Allonocardiopsis opalescens]|uniref:Uncharacterized protein DUF2267 n=2 Tax=Allonocardiopsis opalescens TaxID=1144618 RepID=A0A2T0QE60_9ACTN|nr:uncharacterized protein DUF2267 [Allonocardiopsis opalescens]